MSLLQSLELLKREEDGSGLQGCGHTFEVLGKSDPGRRWRPSQRHYGDGRGMD